MSARARFWGIVLLIVAALTLCVVSAMNSIQSDLLIRAQTALAAAGVPYYGVTVDGRDVVLGGRVASETQADRIRTVVAGLDGVRQVHDAMTVERIIDSPRAEAPPSVVLAPARLRAQRLGGRLLLGGTLPADGSADALLRAARERFGPGNVTTDLRVRDGVDRPAWLGAPDRLVELLELASDNLRMVLKGGTGILAGQVAGPADVERLRDMAASIPGLDWRFELFARGGPPASGGGG